MNRVCGALNGVTRFYGPHFGHLGGAHVDLGNAYLQPPQADAVPRPGQLLLFPSWLPHQALPYDGQAERVIVSFNASVHAAAGDDRLHGYAAGFAGPDRAAAVVGSKAMIRSAVESGTSSRSKAGPPA